ncbi:hypothetical protein BJV78DRAFT_1260759, partial [Lactifluus subvellereus]
MTAPPTGPLTHPSPIPNNRALKLCVSPPTGDHAGPGRDESNAVSSNYHGPRICSTLSGTE